MTRMEAYKLEEEIAVERKAEAAKVFELKRKEGAAVCRGLPGEAGSELDLLPPTASWR